MVGATEIQDVQENGIYAVPRQDLMCLRTEKHRKSRRGERCTQTARGRGKGPWGGELSGPSRLQPKPVIKAKHQGL